MIMIEMVHDARIIRMGGGHLPATVRPWLGDSIGRWEGDTLVIETTNFSARRPTSTGCSSGRSEACRRACRSPSASDASMPTPCSTTFTIDDPATFTRPWSGEVPFEKLDERIYEYACHEGNYALMNVLSGERSQERDAAQKKKSPQQ